ncbi:MAG TPA: glutathione transferase [Castellaniella sp.]|uniref:glutathione transferase n=1 Tax=Castellaniella sp. TaxID=1955812 RepID=UPI002F0D2B55
MTAQLVLYTDANFFSPYAMAAYVALAEKDLAFKVSPVDLAKGEQHRPEYRALSATGKVPLLVQGDFRLAESSAITEYVSEAFPGRSLYPADMRERAQARQIQAWVRTDLGVVRQERSSENMFRKPAKPLPALSDAAQQAANKLIAFSEQALPHGKNQLFSSWSIADFELAFMLNRLVSVSDPVPARLVEYVHSQWNRASVQRWVALQSSRAQ